MGPLASHMVMHILLMNLLAPLAAMSACAFWQQGREPAGGALAFATAAQLLSLWLWHAPPLLTRALASAPLHLLMYGSLLLTAFLFWWVVLRFRGNHSWKPILSLLVTSKLYCVLGVLFLFAPRVLFTGIAGDPGTGAPTPEAVLADQQLAGLLMLTACPATYILGGIVLGARWLFAMETDEIERPNTGEEAWT
ncbi:cytochrome c oxidase assembly protein [Ensifer sp. NBAIM29]|nr:cytochrome c oxidase assembly protein [Ensifer sp. NBAIM29]